MHYIVELKEQLRYFGDSADSCFINIISTNDNQHPKLSKPCLVYFRPFKAEKGYIAIIDHSEGFSLEFEAVVEMLSKYKQIYCLNSKYHSYFVDLPMYDINYLLVEHREIPMENRADTMMANRIYRRSEEVYKEVNRLIPISKLYEHWEGVYEKLRLYDLSELEDSRAFITQYESVYKQVEERGIRIDTSCFIQHFTPRSISDFYRDGVVYTSYNLYNTTMRPTNAFNSINFLAINKENESRKCFIPQNDFFVDFDFDGYHIRLIANLINYSLPVGIPVHTYFGQQYFNKGELTEEEYLASKQITFQNIYGNLEERYAHIPFFKALTAYLSQLHAQCNQEGVYKLPTGRVLKYDPSAGIGRVFNYIIQNIETKTNVELLSELLPLFKNKLSFINLIVYDSFLVDYNIKDGKQLLLDIVNFFKEKTYIVKVKYGKNYHALKKTDYL